MSRAIFVAMTAAALCAGGASLCASPSAAAADRFRRVSALECEIPGDTIADHRTDGALGPGMTGPFFHFDLWDNGVIASVEIESDPTRAFVCPIPHDSYFPVSDVRTLYVYYSGPTASARACRSFVAPTLGGTGTWFTCGPWAEGSSGMAELELDGWASATGSAYVEVKSSGDTTVLRGVYMAD